MMVTQRIWIRKWPEKFIQQFDLFAFILVAFDGVRAAVPLVPGSGDALTC